MKIGYVLKKFPRLSETFILNEILSLEKLGHEVEVVSLREPDDEPRHASIQNLKAAVHVLGRKKRLEKIPEECKEPGDHLFRVYGSRGLRRVEQGLRLQGYAERQGFDHIHAHFMTVAAQVAAVSRAVGGPTFTVTAHAKDIFRRDIDEDLFRCVMNSAQRLITVSDFNAAYIARRFCHGHAPKVLRIYNGLPLSDAAFHREPQPRESDHLLTVGRLVPKKGIDQAVRALGRLRRSGSPATLTIVGDGESRANLEALVSDEQLTDCVDFCGPLPREQVFDLMRRATLLVQPCCEGADGNRDALPTVLIEAMALGLPVISTEFVGIPEIVRDGDQGLLVPVNDLDALEDRMRWALDHPDWLREASRLGPLRAQRVFDAALTSKQLSECFESAIASVEAKS